jgi:GMP synthase (glutamine-hydrolysing)
MTTVLQDSAAAFDPSSHLMRRREALRVLLLQVRDQPAARHHEELCFVERLGLRAEQLVCVNVLEEAVPDWAAVAAADLVLLGGAGSHSAYRDYPFTAPLSTLVQRLVEEGRPFFGSCFGHQFLARALGGTVVHDPERSEVGTFEVKLSEAGRADPLFAGLPSRFLANLGHNDQVAELPPNLVCLASSELCRHQVVRVPGRPVYATQFHCELSIGAMYERLMMYRTGYLRDDEEIDQVVARFRPTDEADGLLRRFVELCL